MAFVTFPHKVKFKGKYYAPGTPIEIDSEAEKTNEGASKEPKKSGKRTAKSSAGSRKSRREQ